jgi:hypothetical protein
MRKRVAKSGCIELKSFFTTKETITRIKRQSTGWETTFATYSFNLLSLILCSISIIILVVLEIKFRAMYELATKPSTT